MSIQAVAWVLDHSRSRGFARLVLISLANHHSAVTDQCNPGQRLIAQEAGMATGSVPAQIRKLVELGEVEVVDAGGSHRSASYRLTFTQQMSEDPVDNEDSTLSSDPSTLRVRSENGEVRSAQDRAEPRTGNLESSILDRDFSDWWSGYPRKIERKQALSAYKARRREGVDHSRLVAARDNYRHAKAGTDPTYIKHGSSFLAKDGPWSEWESGPPEVMVVDVFGPPSDIPDLPEPKLVLPPARVETCPTCESSLLACVCPDRGVPRKAQG